MQVSKAGIERIRAANPLAAVAAERGIELRRKGNGLVGLCPFHREKTPSFSVSPDKGLFRCFGCDAGGDVISFVVKHDGVSFPEALRKLSSRAGISLEQAMEAPASNGRKRTPSSGPVLSQTLLELPSEAPSPQRRLAVPPAVVDYYHRTFCERDDAQGYLRDRGLTDLGLLKALKVGYADGSLLKRVAKDGPLREQLVSLGIITRQGRELLGGCIVVPIPDPVTGEWTSLYGRGRKTPRHCYLPGPMRGVVNFQAARLSSEVILTESVLDALSFLQAGFSGAIPIYGVNGFTPDHLDLLKREGVTRVILALDGDAPGRKAASSLKAKLQSAGLAVRVASFPPGTKDANSLLVSRNGDATAALRQVLGEAEPKPAPNVSSPLSEETPSGAESAPGPVRAEDGQLVLQRDEITYRARAFPPALGRLRATVKVERGDVSEGGAFHVDTVDLYASRSRSEFGKRAAKATGLEPDAIEQDLLALLVEAEKASEEQKPEAEGGAPAPPPMSGAERSKALAFLKRPDLLDQVGRDVDALGYVGEETNKRLLYLIAISRKLPDPLSAIVLSQSGAGKSGITEVIERLTPPEDVVLLTRLTPQSLYYVGPGFLDQKLVIIEERYGSMEADYSIRVLQSRKKLIAAAPVKDPQTGNMRTKVFSVEARAAFVEATTASSVNHENATRCFELQMDESAEQTRRIHERQRLMKTAQGLKLREQADVLAQLHWNAQRLLEPVPVVIPYADRLSFPTAWMRTRRDHARFLNLIEVSAFLHQYQRERRDGAIVADVADYAVAYGLAGEVLAETLTDVRRPLREAFERVKELSLKGEGTVSRREIREALRLPDSTVRRWLQDLVELEYLAVVEAGRQGAGRTTRYRLTEARPQDDAFVGLLSPEELRARL
jgi:DNA primase catalytic core